VQITRSYIGNTQRDYNIKKVKKLSKLKWRNLLYYTTHWPMADNEKSERKEEKEQHQDMELLGIRK
jgi:hypothetical protein